MKKLTTLFILILSFAAALAQTQTSLPTGSTPFSSNLFLSPNSDVWTGKPGKYINLAKKEYVDNAISNIDVDVTPTDLSVGTNGTTNDVVLPARTGGASADQWALNGVLATNLYNDISPNNNFIVKRLNGRAQFRNGVGVFDAVNKRQLDSLALTTLSGSNLLSNNLGTRSMVGLSVEANIGSGVDRGLILNSQRADIKRQGGNGYSISNAIIASDSVVIFDGREQSAIIASSFSRIDPWSSASLIKWNSVIIGAYNARIQAANSYTLVTGQGTVSNGSAQIVGGLYNVIEPSRSVTDPLKKSFILGNGGNTEALERSNAFYVTHGGRAWVQNEMEVDAAGGGVVLKAPNGTRWRLTVSNTGTLTTTQIP